MQLHALMHKNNQQEGKVSIWEQKFQCLPVTQSTLFIPFSPVLTHLQWFGQVLHRLAECSQQAVVLKGDSKDCTRAVAGLIIHLAFSW